MRNFFAIAAVLLLLSLAPAALKANEAQKKVANPAPVARSAAPAASAPKVIYNLRNLKPVGLSEITEGGRSRELLQFKNEQGKQNLLYEEVSNLAALKQINRLAPFMASTVHTCSIDLECREKAFCTDNCRSLFYELTNLPANTPATAANSDKNNCEMRGFTCVIEQDGPRAPAASQATAPVAASPAAAPPATPAAKGP